MKDTNAVAHPSPPDPEPQPKPSNLILFDRPRRPIPLARDPDGQLGQSYAESCTRQLVHRLRVKGEVIELTQEVLRRCLIDAYNAGLGDGCDTVYDAVMDRAEARRRKREAR